MNSNEQRNQNPGNAEERTREENSQSAAGAEDHSKEKEQPEKDTAGKDAGDFMTDNGMNEINPERALPEFTAPASDPDHLLPDAGQDAPGGKQQDAEGNDGLTASLKEYEDEQEDEPDEDGGEAGGEEEKGEEAEDKYDQYSRDELVSKLEVLVDEEDISTIKTRVALIKVAFLKKNKEHQQKMLDEFLSRGGKKEEYTPAHDALKKRFDDAFQKYKSNKKKYLEELEKRKKENLSKKEEILEKLRALINSEETLKKTYDEFKELQDQWKKTGLVPAGKVADLWQSYHFLVEKFFDKVKINKELRDLDLKKNLEAKMELCEKTEELLLETSIIRSFRQLQKHHEEWKDIGPVPADKREEIWGRFKAATDKINERRREYYDTLHEEQEKNLLAKQGLCDKAEQIVASDPSSMKEWQELTGQINELFKLWRTIGRAPKKHNDDVWKRFKSYLNTFFNNRKEYLSRIKEEQVNNYNLKLDLCVQAERMKDSSDWKNTTRDLINLQKEWKKIGPVPKKHSDRIWKRFRAACDVFFNRKSEYFKHQRKNEEENLKKKKELIDKVLNHDYGEDKNQNLEIIKEFQRQFMDIGFVPIKEKDAINNEFRNAVDEQLEKLKISAVELSKDSFRNKIESFRDAPGGDRLMRKEKGTLSKNISQLKEDIQLWENNIGFLAESKKANVLREAFEKKIGKAKKDVAVMEAKLKLLKEADD